MSGWTIGLILGGVAVVLIVGLCLFVLRAVTATAAASRELAEVLAQVQANTAALASLDNATASIQGAAQQLTSGLQLAADDLAANARATNGGGTEQRGRRSKRP